MSIELNNNGSDTLYDSVHHIEMENLMQNRRLFFKLLACISLGACAYPINGDWEGIEQHIVSNGEVAEKRSLPLEDCFSDIDSDAEEETTTCVNRGFSMMVDSADDILFEATNDITLGQQVLMYTKSFNSERFLLSDGGTFEIECILNKEDKEKLLYCDFTNTIGYLNDSKVVFRKQ